MNDSEENSKMTQKNVEPKERLLSAGSCGELTPTSRLLSSDFAPSEYTVVIGRGKICSQSPGNKHLHDLATTYIQAYSRATNKKEKTKIVSKIVKIVRSACPNGEAAFVKLADNGRWAEVRDAKAREKVGHVLRDLLYDQYSSSSKSKAAKRKSQRDILPASMPSAHSSHESKIGTAIGIGATRHNLESTRREDTHLTALHSLFAHPLSTISTTGVGVDLKSDIIARKSLPEQQKMGHSSYFQHAKASETSGLQVYGIDEGETNMFKRIARRRNQMLSNPLDQSIIMSQIARQEPAMSTQARVSVFNQSLESSNELEQTAVQESRNAQHLLLSTSFNRTGRLNPNIAIGNLGEPSSAPEQIASGKSIIHTTVQAPMVSGATAGKGTNTDSFADQFLMSGQSGGSGESDGSNESLSQLPSVSMAGLGKFDNDSNEEQEDIDAVFD